jgi:hypothetical protein
MGLMDRARAQATVLAQKTQETARDSKAKLDQAQAKRRGDAMLRDLGAAVYAERTGRGTPDTAAEIGKLIAGISAYEAENGINLGGEPTGQQPGPAQESQPQPGGSAEGTQPPANGASPGSGTTQV